MKIKSCTNKNAWSEMWVMRVCCELEKRKIRLVYLNGYFPPSFTSLLSNVVIATGGLVGTRIAPRRYFIKLKWGKNQLKISDYEQHSWTRGSLPISSQYAQVVCQQWKGCHNCNWNRYHSCQVSLRLSKCKTKNINCDACILDASFNRNRQSVFMLLLENCSNNKTKNVC